MRLDSPIETPRLVLRTLLPDAVTPAYVGWLNDPEVNRYLEVRFRIWTLPMVREFVAAVADSDCDLLCAIHRRSDGCHIGNIKLGSIDRHHRRGEIGIVIGERSAWGQGFATEAVQAIAHHGLFRLGLDKLIAGAYAAHAGSRRAFTRAGFREEAVIPSYFADNDGDGRTDLIWMGCDRSSLPPDSVPTPAEKISP